MFVLIGIYFCFYMFNSSLKNTILFDVLTNTKVFSLRCYRADKSIKNWFVLEKSVECAVSECFCYIFCPFVYWKFCNCLRHHFQHRVHWTLQLGGGGNDFPTTAASNFSHSDASQRASTWLFACNAVAIFFAIIAWNVSVFPQSFHTQRLFLFFISGSFVWSTCAADFFPFSVSTECSASSSVLVLSLVHVLPLN